MVFTFSDLTPKQYFYSLTLSLSLSLSLSLCVCVCVWPESISRTNETKSSLIIGRKCVIFGIQFLVLSLTGQSQLIAHAQLYLNLGLDFFFLLAQEPFSAFRCLCICFFVSLFVCLFVCLLGVEARFPLGIV